MADRHDPGVDPEDEGIPDLQSGTPQAQRASDPQQAPVPGTEPVASDRHGVTVLEQQEGRSLDSRLEEEEPDVAGQAPEDVTEQEAGLLSDDPMQERPGNQDLFAHESPVEGMAAEERAVHIDPDPERHGAEIEDVGETEEF